MIRQMAIPIALLGFNDLGRSVTPTFLFRSRFYLQLSTLCPKTNKKSMWEVKRVQDFCQARETMVAKGLVKKYRGVGQSREGVGHQFFNPW